MIAWHPSTLPRGRGVIRLELVGDRAELILDSPEARNAISPGMMVDLEQAVVALERFAGVSLLIRGAGERAFCAGGDLDAVAAHLMAPGAGGAMAGFMGPLLDRLAALPLVICAAVEGAALGGGAEILTTADLIVAGEGARIGFVQARLGVSPGWGGGARLVKKLGSRATLRLLAFAGTMNGPEALSVGFIDQCCLDGHAVAQARERLDALDLLPTAAVRAAVAVSRGATPDQERALFDDLWGGQAHRAAMARLGRG